MVCHTVELGTLLNVGKIFVNSSLLLGSGELLNELALGSQYHECHTEDGVGTCGEDGEVEVLTCHLKLHLGTFRTANPVLLGLLDRVAPLYCVQSVEQTL